MEYKIVFSDVDGTLLNSSHLILPSTLTAIEELKRKIKVDRCDLYDYEQRIL